MLRPFIITLSLVLTLALTHCSGGLVIDCFDELDCPDNALCVDGVCNGGECFNSADCADGFDVCENGFCVGG